MTTRVEIGQIWADNDPRRAGRKLRIDDVKANFAFCTVMQNTHEVQAKIDTYGYGAAQDRRGTTTRIGLSRFYDEKYWLCHPDELQAMSVANLSNVVRLPSACTDLTQHRWVPVTVTYSATARPMFFRPAEPDAYVVVAVCPKCWVHTEFPSKRIPAPITPGDLAA
ncbi:hypothetical protein [Streptomyces sp. NPDC058268]|jgi:hypothetical protein|uniref:hypothetical protein n=1 Tax=Streptomyces sp. NPDC058268 TaxID=3346413 RepID=UPI0036EACBA0